MFFVNFVVKTMHFHHDVHEEHEEDENIVVEHLCEVQLWGAEMMMYMKSKSPDLAGSAEIHKWLNRTVPKVRIIPESAAPSGCGPGNHAAGAGLAFGGDVHRTAIANYRATVLALPTTDAAGKVDSWHFQFNVNVGQVARLRFAGQG